MDVGNHLVTGCAGFIGSHLCERLLEDGHTVTGYDNFSSGKMEWIEDLKKHPRFTLIQGDLLDPEKLQEVVAGKDVVWHLGANTDIPGGTENPRLDLEHCTIATFNVLEAMRSTGVKDILFASSATVYGESITLPARESAGPTLPVSLYGAAKMACEGLITAYCHLYDLRAKMFRFGNVIGARMGHGVLHDFIVKLRNNPKKLEVLGDGKQVKPFFLVEECIDGMIYAFTHSDAQYDVFNLGTDTSTNVMEISEIVMEEMNLQNVEVTTTGGARGWPGDVPRLEYDITKMKTLGWQPKHSSSEAIRIAIQRLLTHL